MNSRKILLFLICCTSLIYLGGNPYRVEAANENMPPRAIRLDDIFVTPSTGTNSSILGGNIVQITPAANNQKGGIWSTENNKIDLTQDFRASMYLYLGGNAQLNQSGDGMAFVMHNDPKGTDALSPYFGESLGVWGSSTHGAPKDEGIQNSLAIEFDKYVNNTATDSFFDFYAAGGHHMAWSYSGKDSSYEDFRDAARNKRALIHNDIQYVDNFANDSWRKFEVNWDATNQELTYQLEGLSQVTIPIDVQDIFGSTEVYWGFTGSTGGSNADQRVTFDQVPGLVNARSSQAITKKDGTLVTDDTIIYPGEELTYSINARYLSGKQDWLNVSLYTAINEFATYIPESLTLTEGTHESQLLDDKLWSGNTLTIPTEIFRNLSSSRNEVTISFKVKANSVSEDQIVTEKTYLLGDNLNVTTNHTTYQIHQYQPPEVTIDGDGPIYIPVGEDYVLRGTWRSLENPWVRLTFTVDDIMLTHPEFITNENPGEYIQWSYTLPKSLISLGTYEFGVRVSDDQSATKAYLTFIVVNPPTLTVENANKEIQLEHGDGYLIEGTWSGKDSETVDLFYQINEDSPEKFAEEIQSGDFEYTIPSCQLSVGTNLLTLYAIDNNGLKTNEETKTLQVTGFLAFTSIPEKFQFQPINIPSTTIISSRLENQPVTITDTRGNQNSWKLKATLSEELSDGKGNYLKDALIYIDNTGTEKVMTLNHPITIIEHQTTNEEDVIINWDDDKGILLKITPSTYAGEYTGEITWILEDAP